VWNGDALGVVFFLDGLVLLRRRHEFLVLRRLGSDRLASLTTEGPAWVFVLLEVSLVVCWTRAVQLLLS